MVDGTHHAGNSNKDNSTVERALGAILADSKFAASPQMSAFLAYVVKQTLNGESSRIKAYSVAVDALGKPDSFDAQSDPSVRVLANRLRACLKQYYEKPANHEVIIELKSGSYIPIFSYSEKYREREVCTADAELPGADAASATLARPALQHKDRAADLNREKPVAGLQIPVKKPVQTPVQIPETSAQLSAAANKTTAAAQQPDCSYICDAKTTGKDGVIDSKQPVGDVDTDANSTAEAARTHKDKLTHLLTPLPLAIVACALIVALWVVFPGPDRSIVNPQLTQNLPAYTTQLANYNMAPAARIRPALPTLKVRAAKTGGDLSRPLVSPVSGVVADLDYIELLDSTDDYYFGKAWPEDYELSVDSLVLSDQIRITVTLSHPASSRVVDVEALELAHSGDLMFSSTDIKSIEDFVAQLLRPDGPMISDYRVQIDAESLAKGIAQQP